jgi:hypothetical protein
MVSMPGATPEKFYFTVRDHAVAQQIAPVMGKRVTAPRRGKGWAPDLLLRQDQVFRYPGDGRRREPAGARRHRDRAAAGAANSGLPEELSSCELNPVQYPSSRLTAHRQFQTAVEW